MNEADKSTMARVLILLVVWVLAGVGATLMAEGATQDSWSVMNLLAGALTLGVALYIGISQLCKADKSDPPSDPQP